MARANKMWRTLAVMGAALAALAITTAAFAQAPPTPPHAFFGSPADGSGVTIDGNAAPAGTVVTAWNENGDQVGTATLDAAGLWVIQVDPAMAMSVTFTVAGAATSGSFDVESGDISPVALSVGGAAPPPPDDAVPPRLRPRTMLRLRPRRVARQAASRTPVPVVWRGPAAACRSSRSPSWRRLCWLSVASR